MANITEFFQNKHIFVTGGTGFMGKVLLEKLLRSCSDVGNIYILIRPKKGKDPREQIKDITNQPVTYLTSIHFNVVFRSGFKLLTHIVFFYIIH
jgi:thioester reductase-like protein